MARGVKVRFAGSWRITSMEQWDREYMDLVVRAHITFAERGMAELQFGTVSGQLDCRYLDRDGAARVEFSWEGDSEGDTVSGRGWAELRSESVLEGRLHFHLGDESGFTARRRRRTPAGAKSRETRELTYWAGRPRGRPRK